MVRIPPLQQFFSTAFGTYMKSLMQTFLQLVANIRRKEMFKFSSPE